jgi:hypothetical protein
MEQEDIRFDEIFDFKCMSTDCVFLSAMGKRFDML